MRERDLSVRRTARIVELGAEVARPASVWFVLHGYRQLADRFLRRFVDLDDGTRRIVAPEAPHHLYLEDRPGRHGPQHPVGASWMTRHRREVQIADYVAFLDAVAHDVEERVGGSPRRFVLGFSQGQHTAARWCALGATSLQGAVFWGDVMPDDLPADAGPRFARMRCVAVRGEGDRHLTPARLDADTRRWRAWGVSPERVVHPGGHDLEPEALARVMRRMEEAAPG